MDELLIELGRLERRRAAILADLLQLSRSAAAPADTSTEEIITMVNDIARRRLNVVGPNETADLEELALFLQGAFERIWAEGRHTCGGAVAGHWQAASCATCAAGAAVGAVKPALVLQQAVPQRIF